jgi:hypothetical protein
MTSNELTDAAIALLKAGATTQLALTKVYKCAQQARRGVRTIEVVWLGSAETPVAMTNIYQDEPRLEFLFRMPVRDPDQTVTEDGWYTNFLALIQEVRDLLTTAANRSLTAGGETAFRARIIDDASGFDAEADEETWLYTMTVQWDIQQD